MTQPYDYNDRCKPHEKWHCDLCLSETLPEWTGKVPHESKRPVKTVVVYSGYHYWLESTFAEITETWHEYIKDVPAQYRNKVKLDIDTEESYGSTSIKAQLTYRRPMLVAEYRKSQAVVKYHADIRKERELEQLAKLQEKYKK